MTLQWRSGLRFVVLALGAAMASACVAEEAPLPAGNARNGGTIVEAKCAACHSLDAHAPSPHADAPPFPFLNQRVVIENLAEALAEGIGVGHQDMPEFVFEPSEIDDILAYLESIQTMPAPTDR